VAPPGNQAATEKTNINLYYPENPAYSPKALIINYFLSDKFFEPFSINPWVNSQSKVSWQLE